MKYKFSYEATANQFKEDLSKDPKVKNLSVTKNDDSFEVSFDLETKSESNASYEASKTCDEATYCVIQNGFSEMRGWMDRELSYIHRRISEVEDTYYKHKMGHLPQINDAVSMKKALEALGLADSYEVVKPIIRVEASRLGDRLIIG